MKTISQQDKETSHLNFGTTIISKRTVWNRRRHYSYLTQFKLNY